MFSHSGIHMACRHTNVCVIRITRTSKFIRDIRQQSKRSITLERKIRGSFHGSKYTLISILNLSLIKFAKRFANWLEVFP